MALGSGGGYISTNKGFAHLDLESLGLPCSHPDGDTEGQSETLPLSTAVSGGRGRYGGEVWSAAKDDLPHLSSQPLPAADP